MPFKQRINSLKRKVSLAKEKLTGLFSRRKALRSIAHSNTKRTTLTFTPWFEVFMKKNRVELKNFLKARRQILNGKESVSVGGLKVERLKKKGMAHSHLYKVDYHGKSFFVKEQKEGKHGKDFLPQLDLAEPQLRTLSIADEILKRVPGARVAKFHLAWTSGENSMLVTDFYEGQEIVRSNEGYAFPKDFPKINLDRRISAIRNALSDISYDARIANMIYLPKTDEIIVFDLRPGYGDSH
jgi:hypothetical protein